MNKQTLKNISDITAGYSFRTALERGDGSMFVLQAKNITDNLTVDEDNLDSINFENYKSQAIVEKGDVVISSRGHFRAGLVSLSTKNVIAASSVYVLRIKSRDVIPDYLAIFLNSDGGQKQIKEISAGAVIPAILRKDLEDIVVPIPTLSIQEKIVMLYHSSKKLQRALKRKAELIDNLNESVLNKLLKN